MRSRTGTRRAARALPLLAFLIVSSIAAPLLAQTFDFRQPQHSFLAPGGSSGVLPDYDADEIGLDQNRDGLPDGTWNLPPEIQSIANTVLQHDLSPSQSYLITIRSRAPFGSAVCGGSIDNVEVFYHHIDPEPLLVSFGSACLRGPVSIGPLWWDPDEPPPGMPVTSMVVGKPDVSTGNQPLLWADLVGGEVGIDMSSYGPNVSVTAEGIQISPFGNAVFIRHGTSTSFPDRFSMVDLCADPLGGNVSTHDEPLLTTGIKPRLVIEGVNISAEVELIVSGAPQTQVFQLDDCSIGEPPPPPPPDSVLTVTVTGSGAASVASTPAGIQCPIDNTCSASFARGTLVTLKALPGPGAGLIAWSGDCSGAAPESTVLLDSDRACTATFGAIALEIEKTAAPSIVRQGDELAYTLTYRNAGTLGATNVSVRDTLPAGSILVDAGGASVSGTTLSWNVGSLPPGGNGQLQFRVSPVCSASELTNGSYSIASTEVPSGVSGAPVTTPVTAASSDPVGVVVSSVPARTPLRSGDLVTHTVTLTNTVAEERRGLRFAMNPGGDAAFESVLDAGAGAMTTPNPFNWSWTGDLGPNASTDVIFTTRVDDCLNLAGLALNNRQPISVRNVCGVVVGEGNPAQIPLEPPIQTELSVLGLPPERVEDDFLLARPGETFQLQMSITERYGQDQTAVSIDLPLPAGLSAVGDPPFAPPTDPGATWDPSTATASWSGTLPANGTVAVTLEVMLDTDASCIRSVFASGRAGSCSNLSAGLRVLRVPEPPTGPYLLGLDLFAGVFLWEPGVDRNFAEELCLSPVEILVDMALGDDGQVAVAGLPPFRFDSDPLSLDILKPIFGGPPFLGVESDPAAVAYDPTTGTWVYAVAEVLSGRPSSLRRLDPVSGGFTVIANGLPWLGDLHVEPDGTIVVVVNETGGTEIWRIDPANPGSPQVIADPAFPSMSQLALDNDGDYLAIHDRFNGTGIVHELLEIDPLSEAFSILVGDLGAFLGFGTPTSFTLTVAETGEIYVLQREGVVGVIERSPVLTGSLLASQGTVTNPRTSGRSDENYVALVRVDPGGTQPVDEADLELSKTASPDPVTAGQSLVYTLTVTNQGPDTAEAAAITDPLPAGVSFDAAASDPACSETAGTVTCALGDVAPQASSAVVLAVNVDPAAAGDLTNTATASSNTADPDPTDDQASVTVTVLPPAAPEADLEIEKTASPDPAVLGSPLTYTLTVTNAGPADSTGVTVTDTLPPIVRFDGSASTSVCVESGGTVTCDLGDLSNGAQASATLVVVPTLPADLAVTRFEVLPDRPVHVGESALYRIEVTNHGPGVGEDARLFTLGSGFDEQGFPLGAPPAVTALSVVTSRGACPDPLDTVPLECRFGDLAPGETASVQIAVAIDAPPGPLPQNAENAARVTTGAAVATGTSADLDPGNDQRIAALPIVPDAGSDLRLRTFEVAPTTPIVLGNNLTYTLEVENLGPSPAQDVVLYALARGFDPTSGLPEGAPLDVNVVSVIAPSGSCVDLGGVNAGPLACALGALPPGATKTLELVVSPTAPSVAPGQPTAPLGHHARVDAILPGGGSDDRNPGNNEAMVSSIVLPATGAADLAITTLEAAPSTPILLGQSLVYTLEVRNFGPDSVPDAVLFALGSGFDASGTPLGPPLDVKVDSVTPSQGACIDLAGGDSGPLRCDLGALAPGSAATVTIEVTPRSATTTPGQPPSPLVHAARATTESAIAPGGTGSDPYPANDQASAPSVIITSPPPGVTNGATVTFEFTTDPDLADNTDTITTPLTVPKPPATPSSDLTLTLGGPLAGTAGTVLPLTIDAINAGPDAAPDTTVILDLPPGLSLFSVATDVGACLGETTVVCELGDFPVQGTASIRLDVTPLGEGAHTLAAFASSLAFDPAPADNSDTHTVTVTAGADLRLTKTASPDPAIAGAPLVWELLVENAGPSPATAVTVTDDLPPGLGIGEVSASQGSCQQNGGAVSCALGTLPSGAIESVTIVSTLPASTADGVVLTNSAAVAAAEVDPAPANNVASVSVVVVASADLSIEKSAPAGPLPSRDPVAFQLRVGNAGPSVAAGVTVNDPLPAGTTFDGAGSDPRCAESGGAISCALGDLSPGAVSMVTISLNASPRTVINTATVSAATFDPDAANDTGTASVDVFEATAENIDPDDTGAQYAWAENLGWLNLEPIRDGGPGLEVTDAGVRGWMWGENFGWCSLSCENTASCAAVDYGVANDGQGQLSGFGWCENVGWLSFSCANTSSCSSGDYGVAIDPGTGVFSGEAWGENVGFVSFDSTSGAFEAVTSWRGAAPPPVEELFDALSAELAGLIQDRTLGRLAGAILEARLRRAEERWEQSATGAACLQLRIFELTVSIYQIFGLLTPEDASSLRGGSQEIRGRIGC